ncbi:MAG: ABC transporter permease [Candidatus Binatia bacterium]
MHRDLRKRFWVECVLACLSGGLVVLTLLWHNWIEGLLGVEPDGGDGSLEWALVVLLLGVTAAFSALARTEWRRARTQPLSR